MSAASTPARPASGSAGTVWGVVLAAGAGERFGARKQFAEVRGHRLVDLAIRATARACDGVVAVLPPGVEWDGPAVNTVVPGGATRAQSVRRALGVVPDEAAFILLHAASHPLAAAATFEAVLSAVRGGVPAAVPGLRPSDVVRRVADGVIVEAVGRGELVLVQSPVAFRADLIRAAYAAERDATEDTELVAALGQSITVVPGDPRNIHVTTPQELDLIACLLAGSSLDIV